MNANTTPDQQHARALRIARLWILLQRAAAQLDRVRTAYDVELLMAVSDGVTAAEIGHEVLVLEGKPPTEANATRAEWNVRRALRAARKRRGITDPVKAVEAPQSAGQGEAMSRRPIVVREYWFEAPPPSTGFAGVDVGEYDLDDLDERLRDLDQRDAREDREHDDRRERDEHRDTHNREERR